MHIKPVLDTIKYVKNQTKCHLELTTLLIENENDSLQEIKNECVWILENLGDYIPLHFSKFYPKYKFLHKNPTSFKTLFNAYDIAKSMGLKYVYLGNISNVETSSTYCKNCNSLLIKRNGYNIEENNIVNSRCKFCKTVCDGFFD